MRGLRGWVIDKRIRKKNKFNDSVLKIWFRNYLFQNFQGYLLKTRTLNSTQDRLNLLKSPMYSSPHKLRITAILRALICLWLILWTNLVKCSNSSTSSESHMINNITSISLGGKTARQHCYLNLPVSSQCLLSFSSFPEHKSDYWRKKKKGIWESRMIRWILWAGIFSNIY